MSLPQFAARLWSDYIFGADGHARATAERHPI
jgi:hypothetical protein